MIDYVPCRYASFMGTSSDTESSNSEDNLTSYAMKSMKWDFHVDDSQSDYMYYMILCRDILSKLKIDLCFPNNTRKGNGGAYE